MEKLVKFEPDDDPKPRQIWQDICQYFSARQRGLKTPARQADDLSSQLVSEVIESPEIEP